MNRVLTGCLPYLALALVGVLAFPFLGGMVVAKLVAILWIVGFGSISLAKFRHGLESRDKYDLGRLKRVHEREEIRRAEIPLVATDADETVCPRCGNAYSSRIPVCPNCGSQV